MIKRGKNKKAQQILGMPFSLILSLLLIAVFLAVAFFAIRHFLNIKQDVEVGTFLNDFQKEITSAWNSQSSSKIFHGDLPKSLEFACFANLSASQIASIKDKQGKNIFTELKKNADYRANFYFYPQRYAGIPSTFIEHVNTEEMSNPYCISVEQGKIEIKIEKSFFDALVKISEA